MTKWHYGHVLVKQNSILENSLQLIVVLKWLKQLHEIACLSLLGPSYISSLAVSQRLVCLFTYPFSRAKIVTRLMNNWILMCFLDANGTARQTFPDEKNMVSKNSSLFCFLYAMLWICSLSSFETEFLEMCCDVSIIDMNCSHGIQQINSTVTHIWRQNIYCNSNIWAKHNSDQCYVVTLSSFCFPCVIVSNC